MNRDYLASILGGYRKDAPVGENRPKEKRKPRPEGKLPDMDIELQMFRVKAIRSRILYYLAFLLTAQMTSGDKYSKIKPR